MAVTHISGNDHFKKEVVDYPGVVLVDFWAEWCGPCRMLGPIMDELDHDNQDKNVKIVKVNVDENQDLAAMFQISAIPAVFIIKGGESKEFISGANPKGVYQNKIDELLSSDAPIANAA